MSVRKAGLVTVGALATLFAASPLASAAELPPLPSLPELPAGSAVAPNPCSFNATGTDGADLPLPGAGDLPGVIAKAPIAGDNIGNVGKCSTYGQRNDQGNGQNNTFSIDGMQLPFPSL